MKKDHRGIYREGDARCECVDCQASRLIQAANDRREMKALQQMKREPENVDELLDEALGPPDPAVALTYIVPGLPLASAKVFIEAAQLQAKKNADYADSKTDPYRNFRMCAEGGIPVWKGVWVRMGDKWSRLQKFVRGGEMQVADESGRDTLFDLLNYTSIAIATFDEEKS